MAAKRSLKSRKLKSPPVSQGVFQVSGREKESEGSEVRVGVMEETGSLRDGEADAVTSH